MKKSIEDDERVGTHLVPVNLESEDEDVGEGNVSDVAGDGTSRAKVLSHLLNGHGFLEEFQETMSVQLIELRGEKRKIEFCERRRKSLINYDESKRIPRLHPCPFEGRTLVTS